MAELEHESILQRQREGIAIAKQEENNKGRQQIKVDKEAFQQACNAWRAVEITSTEAMKRVGLKPNTFYRESLSVGTTKQ